MGVVMYAGSTCPSLNTISIAAPDNSCRGWWVHGLKALEVNIERKYCSRLAMFSLVAGKGSLSGISGVGVRFTQGTSSSSYEAVALVEQFSIESSLSTAVACIFDTPGKPSGRSPSSNIALSERYRPRVFRDT